MKILAGQYKNRQLKTPKGDQTRPTSSKVRKSVFDILQNQIEGARFLDLFAGSGSMGLEALSRGAKSVTFVEQSRQATHCIRDNLKEFKITAPVIKRDALIAIKQLIGKNEQFDIIYIDPPYAFEITPLLENIPPLLAEEGIMILEQSKRKKINFQMLKKLDERQFGDTTLYFLRGL